MSPCIFAWTQLLFDLRDVFENVRVDASTLALQEREKRLRHFILFRMGGNAERLLENGSRKFLTPEVRYPRISVLCCPEQVRGISNSSQQPCQSSEW